MELSRGVARHKVRCKFSSDWLDVKIAVFFLVHFLDYLNKFPALYDERAFWSTFHFRLNVITTFLKELNFLSKVFLFFKKNNQWLFELVLKSCITFLNSVLYFFDFNFFLKCQLINYILNIIHLRMKWS